MGLYFREARSDEISNVVRMLFMLCCASDSIPDDPNPTIESSRRLQNFGFPLYYSLCIAFSLTSHFTLPHISPTHPLTWGPLNLHLPSLPTDLSFFTYPPYLPHVSSNQHPSASKNHQHHQATIQHKPLNRISPNYLRVFINKNQNTIYIGTCFVV